MRTHPVVSVLLLLFAGWALVVSSALPFGTARVPQAGFFPTILSVLLMTLALLSLFEGRSDSRPDPETMSISAANWFRLGVILVALAGFVIVLEQFGFLLSSFLLMVSLLRAIEPQNWPRITLIAFAAALISYVIFAHLLGVALPAGILGI